MNFRTKPIGATFALSAVMLAGMLSAQTIQEGLNYLGNEQFSKAKGVFEGLVSQSPTADNYYYLGYCYLQMDTPNIEQASQNFTKGLAAEPKSNLNKIGLAAIKLYQGNKAGANADFEAVAKDTKYKNADVLSQIANAYILFKNKPESIDTDKSIEYSQKLLELVKNKDKAAYYITLGNAYYLKKDAGKAVSNYSKALDIADNKAEAYALIGNIWGRSSNTGLATENFNKAIAANPNYPVTYKFLSDYNILTQNYKEAQNNLQKYIDLTGNNDEKQQLGLADIAYFAKDYDKSISVLDKSWNTISDPLKYRIKALALLEKSEYAEAYKNINQYMSAVPDAKKEAMDYGVLGKIQASMASAAQGAEKEKLTGEAIANLTKAQMGGDRSFEYGTLLSGLNPALGGGNAGVSTPKIEALKKSVAANPNDTKALYELALEQYNEKDYMGSIATWDKLIALIPDWTTSYAGKAMALYAYDTTDASGLAGQSYQKYIDMVAPKQAYSDTEKAYLAIAYSFFAYKYYHAGDKDKAQEFITKTLAIEPENTDALNLQKLM